MEKTFYGVKLIIKEGTLGNETVDVYISDSPPITRLNAFHVNVRFNLLRTFENIFRSTMQVLLSLNRDGHCKTVAIGNFTKDIGGLRNYQIIRAILCGMYGFCLLTNEANPFVHRNNIREIYLIIPPEDASVIQELKRMEDRKKSIDLDEKKPNGKQTLQRVCCSA